jgi:hypothetical protein
VQLIGLVGVYIELCREVLEKLRVNQVVKKLRVFMKPQCSLVLRPRNILKSVN